MIAYIIIIQICFNNQPCIERRGRLFYGYDACQEEVYRLRQQYGTNAYCVRYRE